MGLPPAPPPPVAQPGARPGVIYPPGGTQFRPQPGADVMQGLAAFIKNYRDSKDSVQQHYMQRFMNGLQMRMAGLEFPPDELAKLGKKAGLPSEMFSERSPEEKLQRQAEQMNQATRGGTNAPGMPALAGGPMQAPPSPAQVPPGFLARLKSSLGVGRPAPSGGPGTPLGDFLSRVQTATQQAGSDLPGQIKTAGQFQNIELQLKKNGLDLSKMSVQQQQQLMGLVHSAIGGDPQAVETLTRSGIWKDMPMDDTIRAFTALGMPPEKAREGAAQLHLMMSMGIPQLRLKAMEFGEKNAGRFGGVPQLGVQYFNDLLTKGQSQIPATYTPQEIENLGNIWNKVNDAYPNLPVNLSAPLAHLMFDKSPGADSFLNYISQHYQRTAQNISASEKAKLTGQMPGGGNTLDYNELALKSEIERGQLDLSKLKTIVDAGGEETKGAWDVINKKDSTQQALQGAWGIIANAANRLTGLKTNYRGQEFPISDPISIVSGYASSANRPGAAYNPFSSVPFRQPPYPQLPTPPPGVMGTAGPTASPTGTGHPDYPALGQRFRSAFGGLTNDEATAVGKNAGIAPNNVNSIMDSIRRLSGQMPPPLPTGSGPMTQPALDQQDQQDNNE